MRPRGALRVLMLFVSVSSCKTMNADDSHLSAAEDDAPVVCMDTENAGLNLGNAQVRKAKKRAGDAFVLSKQCQEAARREFQALATRTQFVCSCVYISAQADRFSKSHVDKNLAPGKRGDQIECLRHIFWQSHLSCQWGANAAQTMGDVREEKSEPLSDAARLDRERDQYHNTYGRRFMESYQMQHGYDLSLAACHKVSGDIARYAVRQGHCGHFGKTDGSRQLIRIDEGQITSSAKTFSMKKVHL